MVRVLLVTAFLIGSATISYAGPIVNGSFEDPACTAATPCVPGGSWGLFESIPGWTSPVGKIEIGIASLYGIIGHDGAQVLELDSDGNAAVAQIIAGPGTFMLSFLYADRNNAATETFEAYWNGVLLAVPPPLANPPNNVMTLFSTTVIALAGSNTLEFKATGGSDSLGALIDDVQLNSVPDGGFTALLLGVGVFGLRYVRRIVG